MHFKCDDSQLLSAVFQNLLNWVLCQAFPCTGSKNATFNVSVINLTVCNHFKIINIKQIAKELSSHRRRLAHKIKLKQVFSQVCNGGDKSLLRIELLR